MRTVRFLHAADLHIDSPLRGLERYEGAPVDELRGATRVAFDNLIDHAIESAVDFVVISGDIYDGNWKDYQTGLYFVSRVARLANAGIDVVMIRGNHDAASRITRSLRLPDRVRDLSTAHPETVVLEHLGVAIHGQGYATPAVTSDLADLYPLPIEGLFNIGLLHTSIDGREGHAPYAPTRVPTMVAKGYDYWALGHAHTFEVVHEDPWIVFSGNLQGRQMREFGPKGCVEVTIEDGRLQSVTHVAVDVVRWATVRVDVSECEVRDEVFDAARDAFESEVAKAGDRLVAVRVVFVGSVRRGLDRAMRENFEDLVQQVRATASGLAGRLWVEKVVIDVRHRVDIDAVLRREDPLGDLLRWIRVMPDDDVRLRELMADLTPLRKRLPTAISRDGNITALDNLDHIRGQLDPIERMVIPFLVQNEDDT